MRVLEVSKLHDAVVIHFETTGARINAYTLASTLVAIADAAKAANADVNPGYDIEVVVEAIGAGSFRAKIRAIYTRARNLFSGQTAKEIIIGIIGTFIYEHTLSRDNSVKVDVRPNEVIIQRGDDRVIVPRTVYDATCETRKNPQFVGAIARTFEAVVADDSITAFALLPEMTSSQPGILIPKDVLQNSPLEMQEGPLTRTVTEQCKLQITKAILERSKRKWEFVWRGVKISAPVLDEAFYARFFAHEITIAPGDSLTVNLALKQSRDPKTCIYTNVGYEVIEVLGYHQGMRQMPLNAEPNAE